MEVFKELTGIDLEAMGEQKAKQDKVDEAAAEKRAEEEKKAAAEEAVRQKAAAEAALPEEEKAALEQQRAADAKKLEGNAAYKAKDFPNAIRLYSEAIDMNPKEMTFYTNLAAVYFEQGEYDKVIEECEKAV